MTDAIRTIELVGEPYDRGVAHGRAARDEIRTNLDTYRAWFSETAGLEWPEVTRRAQIFTSTLDAVPALAEELRGISDGAGVPETDIVALNFRTEIGYNESVLGAPSECTAMAATGEVTSTGATLIAQNWDWLPETRETLLLCHHRPSAGVEFLTFTEAGMLAKFGVNAAGLTVCVNFLASSDTGVGLGFHALARLALEQRSLTPALRAVTGNSRAGAGNFLIASADGEVVDLEWTANDYSLLFPVDGVLAHANHFECLPAGVVDRTKLLRSASPGTYLRTERARRLLTREQGVDLPAITRVLRDHADPAESICRHQHEQMGDNTFGVTNASFIVDYATSSVHYALGNPCQLDYRTIELPWSLAP